MMEVETSQEHGMNLSDLSTLLQSPASDSFIFSEQEQEILRLWDQEQEIRLEINLLQAQNELQEENLDHLSEEELKAQIVSAERELLTARTTYTLRNQIIENVLITDPILKAVHSGASATQLESRLLPLINERDVISMTHATLSTRLQKTNQRLAALERENIGAIQQNKALAKRMLELANDVKAEKIEDVQDARLRSQLEKLEEDLRKTRKEWRVMKSVAAAIVAGSGVDWAKDPKLLEVVMDEEDELG